MGDNPFSKRSHPKNKTIRKQLLFIQAVQLQKIITETNPDEYNVLILFRGDFLDIQLISKSCARVTVTKREAEDLNIQFDTFQSRSPQTKAFLTYVLSVLTNIGIIGSPNDKITVEVFEQENSDMIIYVSASASEQQSAEQFALQTDDPELLFDYAKRTEKYYPSEINNAQLYSHRKKYFLIFSSTFPKKQLCKYLYTHESNLLSGIKVQKIKEHGTLLCNTPIEKLT